MSYRVEYDPQLKKRYPSAQKVRKKLPAKSLLAGVAVVLAVGMIISSGVLRYFIPGDPDVTTVAFSALMEDIGEGESVSDAFLTFCREIIINAT